MLERGAIDATEWGTMYENISMGFHKIAKYIIYPGVHQPTAPFELVDGHLAVPDRPGIGVDPDPAALAEVTVSSEWIRR